MRNSPSDQSPRPALGLYLHIPFCARKCDYCDFYSLAGQKERMDPYLEALQRAVRAMSREGRAYCVDSVYIGGGTPSYFGAQRICRLLDTVREYFFVAPDCEITAEGNPDSLTHELLVEWNAAGVNRISMGVQSTQDHLLRRIGRLHTSAAAQNAFRAAREAGFQNLSVDLIYGLPGQTSGDWHAAVEEILSWSPEHLSCYGLKVERGTPLWYRRDTEEIPDDDMQADLYLWTAERLRQAGYRHYEISNFARPGCESRHNLKYWLGRPYLGFGPGAYSDFRGRRFGYARDLNGYIASAGRGGPVPAECERPDRRERAREYLMLRLRTDRGIEAVEYRERFQLDFTPLERELRTFAAQGWAEQEKTGWRFTPEGWLRSNLLIGALLEIQDAAGS